MSQAISPKGRGLVCPVCMHQQEPRVLRSTLTLKTTDTTPVSVEGNQRATGCSCTPAVCLSRNDNRGNSRCHCHTSTVPRHPSDVGGLELGRDRAQDPSPGIMGTLEPCSAATTGVCKIALSILYNSGVLYTPLNYTKLLTPLFRERYWQLYNLTLSISGPKNGRLPAGGPSSALRLEARGVA
jgi:hypothetical protein